MVIACRGQSFDGLTSIIRQNTRRFRRIAVFAIAHCIAKADIAWNFGAHFLLDGRGIYSGCCRTATQGRAGHESGNELPGPGAKRGSTPESYSWSKISRNSQTPDLSCTHSAPRTAPSAPQQHEAVTWQRSIHWSQSQRVRRWRRRRAVIRWEFRLPGRFDDLLERDRRAGRRVELGGVMRLGDGELVAVELRQVRP